jgi:hypothetical protein
MHSPAIWKTNTPDQIFLRSEIALAHTPIVVFISQWSTSLYNT